MTAAVARVAVCTLLAWVVPTVGPSPAEAGQITSAVSGHQLVRHGDSLDEMAGRLVLDPQRLEVRFEPEAAPVLVVPYGRISAIHREEATYPRWYRSSCYLTLEYADDAGRRQVVSIRVADGHDSSAMISSIEEVTGVKSDRGVSSLMGLPIYAALAVDDERFKKGASVSFSVLQGHVTKQQRLFLQARVPDGYAGIEGHALDVSPSTLRLLISGEPRELSDHDVLVVSERRTAKGKGALFGLAVGIGLAAVAKASGCRSGDRDTCGMASIGFLLFPGFGALIGTGVGASIKHERILFVAPQLKAAAGAAR
jgi:hypothetical protein